jgi:hypothetical protein
MGSLTSQLRNFSLVAKTENLTNTANEINTINEISSTKLNK